MNDEMLFRATAMPDRDWWQALWPDPQGTLRAIGIKPGMIVLDLCCGDGYFTAALARLVEGRVHALDMDPEMLEQARTEVARQGASVDQWICGDARNLTALQPESIDFVLLANTFHGVPDQTGLAFAVGQVLKTDGQFAIVNWHQIPREQTIVLDKPRGPKSALRMSPDQVRAVVEPAGFDLAELVELPPYHYATVFCKARAKARVR